MLSLPPARFLHPCSSPGAPPFSGGSEDKEEEEGEQEHSSLMIVSFIGLVRCLKLTFFVDIWEVIFWQG